MEFTRQGPAHGVYNLEKRFREGAGGQSSSVDPYPCLWATGIYQQLQQIIPPYRNFPL